MMSDDPTTRSGDQVGGQFDGRLGGRHWTYGPGASAGADRPGRWPDRDDSDGWYSSGADHAHQRHLDALAHTDHDPDQQAEADAEVSGGWLMVDPATPEGVRPLTAAELDAVRDQVRPRSGPPNERIPSGAAGHMGAVEQDTAAAVQRAHRAVHDVATAGPPRPVGPDDETRRAELTRHEPDPYWRADDRATHADEPDAAGWGDAR